MTTRVLAALAAAALSLAGCAATIGTGEGRLAGPPNHRSVALQWRSVDGITGTMTATLPDGTAYAGPFFEITSVERRGVPGPGWWWCGWYPCAPWPEIEFVTRYSGEALATLRAARGEEVHCRLQLARPMLGISGGGEGECEGPSEQKFHVLFPAR